jgi:uncharacterized repeat protein (TIGR03803 family)
MACGWTETVLYRFAGSPDGAQPTGDLTFDQFGNLYGTTAQGGKPLRCGGPGCGTVFMLTPSGGNWTESVLYQFSGGTDGSFPDGGVVLDTSGNLYGTTCCGGAHNAGTVFELTPSASGWTESLLYTFQGSTDGKEPATGLMFDTLGNLYGSTLMAGAHSGGTVFELTPSGTGWTFSLLSSLQGSLGPYGALTMDAAGNLYGTTFQDGLHLYGSAFELTSSAGTWTYSSFHDFTDGNDGGFNVSNLVFDSGGNIYGTAAYGGVHGSGVIFQITP